MLNKTFAAGVITASLLLLVSLLSGCAGRAEDSGVGADVGTAQPETVHLRPAVVATGLDAPWSVAFHGQDALVSERDTGRILVLGAAGPVEVMTVPDVNNAGEGGLLGLAVNDNWLYAYYTTDLDNRIVRYALTGEGAGLGAEDEEVLLEGIPSAATHNGGRLAFGPDKMLYATTGDAGDPESSQELDSLGGKILRLSPDGEIPADNPFPESYVYSLGHRNVQGIAWGENGAMYASEFGQNTWDELNLIEPGQNYGWPNVEGAAGVSGYVDPLQQWVPAEASPSGIAVCAGSVWIANLRGHSLREVPVETLVDPESSVLHFDSELGRIRDVVVTPDGELWLLTNNTDGRGSPGTDDDRIVRVPTVTPCS